MKTGFLGYDEDQEKAILADLSLAEMMSILEHVCSRERFAGTEGEHEAATELADTLSSYGLEVTLHQFEAPLGRRGPTTLQILEPQAWEIEGLVQSFSGSAPPEGLVAEIALHDSDAAADIAGKVRLAPTNRNIPSLEVYDAESRGAVAHIFFDDEYLHEGLVSTIWGTPTPESATRILRTPVVSIRRSDALRIRSLANRGPVIVRMNPTAGIEWQKLSMLDATLRGTELPDRFVLVNGHLDCWYRGATDNGTGNALMMELARVLSSRREQLRRSVRFVMWSGHETGSYAGSTWFADNFWWDLYEKCVLSVKTEAPGALGSTVLDGVPMMPLLSEFARSIVEKETGRRAKGRWLGRDGDLSFWGIGVPSLYGAISRPQSTSVVEPIGEELPRTQPWWWHTRYDTIDKVDPQALLRDTRIYAATVLRLMNADVLPFDFASEADYVLSTLEDLNITSDRAIDLSELVHAADNLKGAGHELILRVNTVVRRQPSDRNSELSLINDAMMQAVRELLPSTYTMSGRFEHDPSMKQKLLPGLQALKTLGNVGCSSEERRFLCTKLVRERNRVLFGIKRATEIISEACQSV